MKNIENKSKLFLVGLIVILLLISIGLKARKEKKLDTTDIHMVLSLEDKIENNTIWCGTFNIIWNDLKNEVAKQDIVFSPQLEIVEHLNKGTFTTKELNENSYYKVLDQPSLELKQKIEKAIKEKFQETSAILEDFDWTNGGEKDYFLYAMLKKEFTFPQVFSELKKDSFNKTPNVSYFGIDAKTKNSVRSQVEVLYYKNAEDFAIRLKTKNEDEVLITISQNQITFLDIYQTIQERSKVYNGSKTFNEQDTLKIPKLHFKTKKEFTTLENQEFPLADGEIYYIKKALQTVELELDKTGGKVKSEAGMSATNKGVVTENNARHFDVDHTFTLFLKEKGKDLPYLAMQVEDITKFS